MNGNLRIEIGTFGSAFQSRDYLRGSFIPVTNYYQRASWWELLQVYLCTEWGCNKVSCLRRCLLALLDVPYNNLWRWLHCLKHSMHCIHHIQSMRQDAAESSMSHKLPAKGAAWLSGSIQDCWSALKPKDLGMGKLWTRRAANLQQMCQLCCESHTSSKTYSGACIQSTLPGFLCSHDYPVHQSNPSSCPSLPQTTITFRSLKWLKISYISATLTLLLKLFLQPGTYTS